jgi:hypothetical protein
MANTCAVHAGQTAVFTCSRCGSFACGQCTSGTDQLCVKCDDLQGAVLGADVSAGGLIGDSFKLVVRFGAPVAAFAVVDGLATTAIAMAGAALPKHFAVIIFTALLGAAVSVIVQGAWIALLASAAQGKPLALGAAFGRGASAAPMLFLCNLFVGLGVGFGLILLLVPGIILALGWCMAASSVVIAQKGPFEAMGESWGLTGGHRANLFLAFLATGAVALVVSMAVGAAGNLMIVQVPVLSPAVRLATSIIGTVAAAPVLTVPVLAYLRVKRNFGAY